MDHFVAEGKKCLPFLAMTREHGLNQAEVSDLGRDVVGWGVAGDKRN